MKFLFKILAIIGALSFIGGLMNDVIFFFGVIIALVFGYLGWRPKKEKFESKTNDVTNSDFQLNEVKIHNKSNEVQKNKDLSQSEIQKAIQSIDEKIKLLISGFDKDLLTEKEFSLKKKALEIKKAELSETYNQKEKENVIHISNKNLFDELTNLRTSELISEKEYLIKKEHLLATLLEKSSKEQSESSNHQMISNDHQSRKKDFNDEFYDTIFNHNETNRKSREVRLTKKPKTQIKIKKILIYVVSCLIIISVGFGVWWNSKWENHFDYVGYFDSGRAKVVLNGKSGFVNSLGNIIIPIKYDKVEDFDKGLAWVKLNNKWGVIDQIGKVIIPLRYQNAKEFKNGFAWVELNHKWGVIDQNGKVIAPMKFDFVDDYHIGKARVRIKNKYGFVNEFGTIITPIKFDNVPIEFDSVMVDGYYIDIAKVELKGKWYFIDNKGNFIKHPNWKFNFDYIHNFVQGIARVSYNGKWGYVNKSGKEIIPLIYDYIGGFYNGLARVEIASKWGVIDKFGTVKIPIKYDHIVPLTEDFPSSGLIECSLNSKYIFIDCNGNIFKTETIEDKIERFDKKRAKINSINGPLILNTSFTPIDDKKFTVGRYRKN